MVKIDREVKDPIVAAVINKLADRSEVGLNKYGLDLTRGDLTTQEWLQHYQDELLDGANYAEVLKTKVEIISRMMAADEATAFEKVVSWIEKFDASHEPYLWVMLIIEEFKELMEAFGVPVEVVQNKVDSRHPITDKIKLLDGACDLVWVTMGLVHSYRWDFDAAFEEVNQSNLSKLGSDGKPLKREDGKIMKGPGFKEPQLKKFVDAGDKERFGDIAGFRKV